MAIKVGDKIPDATLYEPTEEGPNKVEAKDVISKGTVALFAVPGAFTPTCHLKHMPGFVEHADALRQKGVERIVCLTANDPFVTGEWAKASGAPDAGITVLADPTADLAGKMGLSFDGSAAGLGTRYQRFAAIVRDGEVAVLHVEEAPSQADATSAAKLVEAL